MTKKQITNIEVKKNNRNRIFRYIRKAGVVSIRTLLTICK